MRPSGPRRTATKKDVLTAIAAFVVLVLVSVVVGMLVPVEAFLAILGVLMVGYFVVLAGPDLRRRWRARAGRCEGCGYDRSGLLARSPCPECGGA